jgi:transferase CAF17, mitochondrial
MFRKSFVFIWRSTISHQRHSSTSSSFIGYNLTKTERTLFKLEGKDASSYIQHLITNDINILNKKSINIDDHLEDDDQVLKESKCIYSLMLNNRGRIIYDVIIYNLLNRSDIKTTSTPSPLLPSTTPSYLIEIDSKFKKEALNQLNFYRIRKKVDISIINKEYTLFGLFNSDNGNNADPHLINFKDDKINDILICEPDPRHPQIGYRLLVESNNENDADNVKASNFIQNIKDDDDLNNYKLNLYRNGIAENDGDISYGNSIPLEYNAVLLNGVAFNKGCYLGQELVAKTHYTGVVRKRIMPIELK